VRPYKILIFWLPVLIWAAIIFSFSSYSAISVSPVKFTDFVVKKAAHFTEYFILSVLIYRGFRGTTKIRGKYLLLLTLTLTVLYSLGDEFHQSFVPGREPHIRDVIIDSLGGIGALFLLTSLLGRRIIKV